PDAIDANLRRPYAKPTEYVGGFHFADDNGDMTRAVHRCTGVGNCRADRFVQGFYLCPSYDVTRDEKDVTRGRVRVLEELTRGELFDKWDAPEVRDSLDLCLACKACSSDCPTGIDVARYKSEVLYRAYKGKLRPLSHYTLGNLPVLARMVGKIPGVASIANAVMSVGALRKLSFKSIGLDPRRLSPAFAKKPLAKESLFKDLAARTASVIASANPSSRGTEVISPDLMGKRYVVLWADSFSHTLNSDGARAAIELLQRSGYQVLVPPADTCCGLTWITTGQLDTAKKKLEKLLTNLAPFAANGIPIVGVEPSCTAVLRSDLEDLLPEDKRAKLIASMTYTLAELLSAPAPIGPGEDLQLPDLTGVNIVAQPHCHHYSVMGWKADEELIKRTGATLTKVSGCCGLGGIFGMEKGHYELSEAIAERRLLPALREAPEGSVYLADGFSCKTQVSPLLGTDGVHLSQLLLHGRDLI
ncbi:MAG: (Fe-S)-binding protein, partial [Actinomycetaceae bacterium]|nr:(Fe-S)-binding protein [Actinomycetaceae bacterium]